MGRQDATWCGVALTVEGEVHPIGVVGVLVSDIILLPNGFWK